MIKQRYKPKPMKLKRNLEFEKWWKNEFDSLFSDWGEELQLCLVAQGYRDILFYRLMCLFGSGFTAYNIIKNVEMEIETNE